MRSLVRKTLLFTTLPIGIVCILGAYYLYFRHVSEHALARTLSAVAEHRRLPKDVKLDVLGMQKLLQDPEKFSETLQPSFKVSAAGPLSLYQPSRGFWFSVDVEMDIDLICEVYPIDGWSIYCGQLRCIRPCVFYTRPGHPKWWEHPAAWGEAIAGKDSQG